MPLASPALPESTQLKRGGPTKGLPEAEDLVCSCLKQHAGLHRTGFPSMCRLEVASREI